MGPTTTCHDTSAGPAFFAVACGFDLIRALDPASRSALAQTCREMRNLVMQASVRVHLRLHISTPGVDKGFHQSLHQAKTHATKVHLHLTAQGSSILKAAACFCTLVRRVGPFYNITTVQLKGLMLSELIPSWLTLSCPNMHTLELHHCLITDLPDPSTNTIPSCPQLHSLHLNFGPPSIPDQPLERWLHQLTALPTVDTLSISSTTYQTENGHHAPFVSLAFLDCCCAVLGPQLVRLSLQGEVCFDAPFIMSLSSRFPCLTELFLESVISDHVEALLSRVHRLRRLHCTYVSLQQTYAHSACPWDELCVSDLNLPSLSLLPLDGIRSIHITGSRVRVFPDEPWHTPSHALSAVCGTGGVRWGVMDIVSMEGAGAVTDCLLTALTLLPTCSARCFVLRHTRVVLRMLDAMRQNLTNPTLTTIEFCRCSASEGLWGQMLRWLPRQIHTVLFTNSRVLELDFIDMCSAAPWPVVVQLNKVVHMRWQSGWQQRAQAAMDVAGHKHVTITLVSG